MEGQEYRERLARDVERWRRDGVITAEQAQAILAREGAGSPSILQALRMGWLVSAIAIVGALVLGGGVILLFATNWEKMPDPLRVALVLGAILAAYAAAYVVMYRMDMQRIGSALLLLGVVLYQAALLLLAQIYNMPVDSPELVLLGAIGALPMAYLFGSRIVLLLAIAAMVWWQVNATALRYDDNDAQGWLVLIFLAVFGLLLYAVGRLHLNWPSLRRFGEVYLFAGAVIVLGVIYFATYDAIWDAIVEDNDVQSLSAPQLLYVLMGITASVVVAQVALRRPPEEENSVQAGLQIGLLAIAAGVATWPEWEGYALLFNGVFVALAGAIVSRGYLQGDERYVNFGLVAVGVIIVTRYCDTFYSRLAGSAFFIIGGLLLLALAFFLERVRRGLLRSMSDFDGRSADGNVAEASA
jgi:uncharacterized membrane protein